MCEEMVKKAINAKIKVNLEKSILGAQKVQAIS